MTLTSDAQTQPLTQQLKWVGWPDVCTSSEVSESATRHRWSHQHLWTEVRPPVHFTARDARAEWLDLIVLPTSRDLKEDLPGLNLALELASRYGTQLIVVCSQEALIEDFPWSDARTKELIADGVRPLVLDFAAEQSEYLPHSRSAASPIALLRRPVDTGPKRNLGLAMAHKRGARNVLFLDDDIKPATAGPTLDRRSLGYALHQLRTSNTLRAVGFTASEQPDNSVVCHARRLVGYDQTIFLGAGALLVKLSGDVPHFPVSMYNEDWLFLMYLCAGAPDYRKALGWAGDVHQNESPMWSAQRAWSEEVGDLIGEGLMNLFEDHGWPFLKLADESFWQRAIRSRRDMISKLRSKVYATRASEQNDREELPGVEALRAASAAYGRISAKDIVAYLEDVEKDQREWSRRFSWK